MTKPSLFASYIYERLGDSIVEHEHGFATYSFVKDACYIKDIFINKANRRGGLGTELADKITSEAKAKGYNKLIGSINISANGSTDSMRALLSYGFRLAWNDQQMIYLTKEI